MDSFAYASGGSCHDCRSSNSKMAKFQISIRTLLFIVVAVAMLMAAAIELTGRIEDLVANGYRIQAAGDLLVDYLDDCEKWPENWDDLLRYVEAHKSTFQYAPNIKDLQSHVRINFDFDPNSIDLKEGWSDEKPPFIVVTSRYGRTAGATRNPNEFIYDYLRGDVPQSKLNANKKLQRSARSSVLTCVESTPRPR